MYKRIRTIIIALLIALMLVGCKAKDSKPTLETMPDDDRNTITITANKSGISGGGGADITVSEGQKLVIDSTLSKGEIQIRFFRDEVPATPDASVDEILHTNDDPALDVTVNAAETTEHIIDPGSCAIMVDVRKTTAGAIIISTKQTFFGIRGFFCTDFFAIIIVLNRDLLEEHMELKRLEFDLTVCKVETISDIDLSTDFFFIGKTDEEISLVCKTEDTPEKTTERDDGWKGFRIQGILDFSLIGILSKLSGILAESNIGIFAVSTFNTDYILVKAENFERALSVLSAEGYTIA